MGRPAIHPGEILGDEIAELGLSVAELARQIDVPARRLSQVVRGQARMTGDLSLRLGHWFGTSGQFWMKLQSAYELRLAQAAAGERIAALPTRPQAAQ